MKKLFFISIVIAVFAAFFASANPDGLDFISEHLGFSDKGIERTSPMTDYSVGFMPEGGISTSMAGIAGILIILGIFWLATYIMKKSKNKMREINCLFLVSCILCLATPVFAARPLVTDDFYTVASGAYELEFGYASTQNQPSVSNNFGLSFKRGLLPSFDLGIEIPYTMSNPSGLNDIYLHAKYKLWQAGEEEGLTGRIDYKFNNGSISQGLGSGDNDFWVMFIYSKMIGQTKVHLNYGYVNVGVNAGVQEDNYIAYACAIEQPIFADNGELAIEYVANNALTPSPAFIQMALRYIVFSGFKLDVGYASGLNDSSIKNSMTTGFHYEF